ncbi:MAG TPA: DUF4411 family protein [Patescibacteria group bacterium]|nr:DUF4411 family protein [Patescibacteria group bacterium]
MGYVIDTSVLIDAKDLYYGFDLCPGFWEFLDQEIAAGELMSITRVKKELLDREDALSGWARAQPDGFFRDEDAETAAAMRRVSDWAYAGDFRDDAKRDFLDKADSMLVAYALAHSHTVVTHEVHNAGNANERKRIKIPTACLAFGVPSELAFPWLNRRGARFVLPPGAEAPVAAPGVDTPPPTVLFPTLDQDDAASPPPG